MSAIINDMTLLEECEGLENEEGILIEDCPIGDPFWDAWGATLSRKMFHEDPNLEYCIVEEGYFEDMAKRDTDRITMYGRYCILVPRYFFEWLDTKKYKLQLTPHAQLFLDECGGTYCMDAARKKGYMLQANGYWAIDEGDVKLTKAVDDFASEIGRAMDSIPFSAPEKKGPGRPKATPDAAPGTPEYVIKERNKVMGAYKETLEKRFDCYAGYERDKVIARIKTNVLNNAVTMNDFRRIGSLFPLSNGVYDMKTGKFRPAAADDYISAYAEAAYDPDAKDANVEKFLDEFTCKREELKLYLAQVLGVGLDLNMLTRTMCELWGETTTNGKSTLVKAIVAAMGKGEKHGLAQELPVTVIGMSANSNEDSRITPGLAMIGNARLLFASEPKRGMKVDWALVKRLTGGDTVSVNQKYEKGYNLDARATLVMDTNHALRVEDNTVFDRGTIQIIPCDFQVKVKDPDIDVKLSTPSAMSTWVNFMLMGYNSYIENGNQFTVPECAQEALQKNKKMSDRIGLYMSENYIITSDNSKKIRMKELWEQYNEWCRDNGHQHVETYQVFSSYFENKPNLYTMGMLHNQKALCGAVRVDSASATTIAIAGDPLDWYISEYMVMNEKTDPFRLAIFPDKDELDEDEAIRLMKVYTDYKAKVTKAGGNVIEFWPWMGMMMSKKMDIRMPQSGSPDKVVLVGWHLATKEELEAKKKAKKRARFDTIKGEVKKALSEIDDVEVEGAIAVLMSKGIDNILGNASPMAKKILVDCMMSGMAMANIIMANMDYK